MSRGSKQRDAILRAIINSKDHPRADRVYEQVRQEIPNISMGTVYRNLNSLARSGDIRQLDIADGTSRFDGKIEDHYHFRCEQCGQIFDLNEPVDRSISERVAENTGFRVYRQGMQLVGLCNACQANGHDNP